MENGLEKKCCSNLKYRKKSNDKNMVHFECVRRMNAAINGVASNFRKKKNPFLS